MRLSAMCAAGLITAAAAAAQELERGHPVEAASRDAEGGATLARWDGHVVSPDESLFGLEERARSVIETWRPFAARRGYRIDLDPSQRVLVLSNAERFDAFSSSATIVERVLDEMEPWLAPSEAPIVVLRASSQRDAETAATAARALRIDARLGSFVETGGLGERRAVDARLAEGLVRTALSIDAPFVSDWMADGLASQIAEATTGRAIVDGKAVTLRSVRSGVARDHKKLDRIEVDLLAISGARAAEAPQPIESEALAIVACLAEHYTEELPLIVRELGHKQPPAETAKYMQEKDVLQRFLGLDAASELQRALVLGRRYRPE